MSQRIGVHADGRLSLRNREGEGVTRTAAETESLTFILSSSQGERQEKATILLLGK
jgi:hypothetical protein